MEVRAQLLQVSRRGEGQTIALGIDGAARPPAASASVLDALRQALCAGFPTNAAQHQSLVDRSLSAYSHADGTQEPWLVHQARCRTQARDPASLPGATTLSLQRQLSEYKSGGPGSGERWTGKAARKSYRCLQSGLMVNIHPESVLAGVALPHSFVLYHGDSLFSSASPCDRGPKPASCVSGPGVPFLSSTSSWCASVRIWRIFWVS